MANVINYTRFLERAGFNRESSEACVKVVSKMINDNKFKSCSSAYSINDNQVNLPESTWKSLDLNKGDQIYCIEEGVLNGKNL